MWRKNEVLKLAADVNELYVAKGKQVTHVNLRKGKLSEDDLCRLLLGPTGNLRAPTLRVGKKLIVGFQQGMYDDVFG